MKPWNIWCRCRCETELAGFHVACSHPCKTDEMAGGMWAIQQLLSLPTTFTNLTETEFWLHIAIQKVESKLEDLFLKTIVSSSLALHGILATSLRVGLQPCITEEPKKFSGARQKLFPPMERSHSVLCHQSFSIVNLPTTKWTYF